MTMPDRVWIESHTSGEMYDGTGEVYVSGPPKSGEIETGKYIRADIAEELARAASKVTRSYRDETDGIISGMCELEDALARFRTMMKK